MNAPTVAPIMSQSDLESTAYTPWRTLPDGSRYRVRARTDYDSHISHHPDNYGTFADSRTNHRPAGFDGSAFKLTTRSGPLWWMPPAAVKRDQTALRALQETVQAYYLEHWYYVGIQVERECTPCLCCGERKLQTRAVYGIETTALDYVNAELVPGLIREMVEG